MDGAQQPDAVGRTALLTSALCLYVGCHGYNHDDADANPNPAWFCVQLH